MVSPWPRTSLARDAKSIKRFENLQALVSLINELNFQWIVFFQVRLLFCSLVLLCNISIPEYVWYICFQTRSIRNARAEYSVEPAKRISASIVAATDVLGYISVSTLLIGFINWLPIILKKGISAHFECVKFPALIIMPYMVSATGRETGFGFVVKTRPTKCSFQRISSRSSWVSFFFFFFFPFTGQICF